jgi:hypothetical protein
MRIMLMLPNAALDDFFLTPGHVTVRPAVATYLS